MASNMGYSDDVEIVFHGVHGLIFIAGGHFFLDEVVTTADTMDMLKGTVDKEYVKLR